MLRVLLVIFVSFMIRPGTTLTPWTNGSLQVVMENLYFKIVELQVPKKQSAFSPFRFDEEKGMWPSVVRLNFHGDPFKAFFRQTFGVFDNNMFATTYMMSCLMEGKRYIEEFWYDPDLKMMKKGLNAIKGHHDMNVQYNNSLMTFWAQTFNKSLDVYNSYPVNLNDLMKFTTHLPLNFTYEVLEKLGLKSVEKMIKELMGIRAGYIMAFHIPPDFDDTFLNIGLGSLLAEMSPLYPEFYKLWTDHNTNLSSVFDALKYYAYRPFSGDQRVNTIDPRSYYYLRMWLEQEENAGRDVALVPTWIQDTDEVRTWFDKGVMMPFNVNNIDVTVCANFLFAVTSGVINGVLPSSILDDPEILQIYNDTARMIGFQIQTNFSDRPDLALTYYPSVTEFYWFVARTTNTLEETLQRNGSLPHDGMQFILTLLSRMLRTYASPRMLAQAKTGTQAGYDVTYYDDFVGDDDNDYENRSINNAEDRIFTTAMSLNAFLTIWSTQDETTGRLIWNNVTPPEVKKTCEQLVNWLYLNVNTGQYVPYNAVFSGSYKGLTTSPLLYPVNRLELFNGTRITYSEVKAATGRFIQGVEGFIPEKQYEEMMKHIFGHYHTPTVFPGYNNNADFFPFWSSDAYTHVISVLSLAKYVRTLG